MSSSRTTRPNVFSHQDLPPPGGYPKINFKRGIRPRGPPGIVIWALVFASSAYGMNALIKTNQRFSLNRKEKREGRMALLPFLLVESDREFAKKVDEYLKAGQQ